MNLARTEPVERIRATRSTKKEDENENRQEEQATRNKWAESKLPFNFRFESLDITWRSLSWAKKSIIRAPNKQADSEQPQNGYSGKVMVLVVPKTDVVS